MAAPAVVICGYTPQRTGQLIAAVESVLGQSLAPSEVIVVVDHSPELLRELHERIGDPRVTVIASDGPRGLSGARNCGVAAATAAVVAFLDDDAIAAETWLERLAEPYADPAVVGVGGLVVAAWERVRPAWFPDEMLWIVGCSYRGLPVEQAPVRNPIGANMSFRREAMRAAGGFSTELGRVGTAPLGCEESELSVRITRLPGRTRILHQPTAVVWHHVGAERATWSYFRRRCWSEGRSKATMTVLAATPRQNRGARRDREDAVLGTETSYALRVLPSGVARGLRDQATGEPGGLGRALAICAGLAVTTGGYLFQRVTADLPQPRAVTPPRSVTPRKGTSHDRI